MNLTATLLAATRCDEAIEVAAAGLEHARRAGMLASDGVLLAYGQAEALSWRGRWDEAEALVAGGALDTDRPHGTTGAVIAARIACWRGQLDAAGHHRDRAFAGADGDAPAPEALLCAAQIAGREHCFDEARSHATLALQVLERSEDLLLVALAGSTAIEIEADRAEAARSTGRRGDAEATEARAVADALLRRTRHAVDRLTARGLALLADVAAHLAAAEAEHERALGGHDPDRWAAVAERWDGLGFPYPAAVARHREADAVLRGRGNRHRAATAAGRALAAATRLGAAPLADELRLLAQRGRLDLSEPPDLPGVAAPDPLRELGISPREGEVLSLLALGRTNRQIGEELFISEKTASVHVSHLLRKLNVTSRIEAAAIGQRVGSS